MNNIKLKGGYGEHGRSCFMFMYKPDRYCMMDCGILDTDEHPEPYLSEEEAQSTDYLFLSHSHKDHTGAVMYLINKGFTGWIIASRETMRFARIKYDKIMYTEDVYPGQMHLDGVEVSYGRSGHCPGSLWFRLDTACGTYFYSGDYQDQSELYACDQVRGMQADIAVVDMAHDQSMESANTRRTVLAEKVSSYIRKGKKVILPVQTFGRGNEILYLMAKALPQCSIALDERFINAEEKMLESTSWIAPHCKETFLYAYEKALRTRMEEADIVLIADTHLDRDPNREFVRDMLQNDARVVLTGRRREGSFAAALLDEGRAVRIVYPHHSSRADVMSLVEKNDFTLVLPFHTEIKEIWN